MTFQLVLASFKARTHTPIFGGSALESRYNQLILTPILEQIPQQLVGGYGCNVIVSRLSIILGQFSVELADFPY